MNTETEKKTGPAYRIYAVSKEGEKNIWTAIGAAWAHGDGKGFGLQFRAQPLPGAELVLREPKEKED